MSQIILDSTIVNIACSALIAKIKVERVAKTERLISDAMSIERGFFSKRKYSREEAIADIEEMDGMLSPLFWAKQHRERAYKIAHDLLAMSKLSDTVTISSDEVFIFRDYLDDKRNENPSK